MKKRLTKKQRQAKAMLNLYGEAMMLCKELEQLPHDFIFPRRIRRFNEGILPPGCVSAIPGLAQSVLRTLRKVKLEYGLTEE